MWVRNVNFIKYASLQEPMEAITRIRYKDPGTNSTLEMQDDKMKVIFHKPVSAIAPGQSAVFYEDDDVIGGGFIC
jgi:tRNA-specific 2-thiouridylase